jgi:hypothetical protein
MMPEIVDQQSIAETLRHALELDDGLTEPLPGWNEDFIGFVALLVIDRLQFLDPRQPRLALAAATLGVAARPFELALDRFLSRLLAGFFLLQARVFLRQPIGVVALPRNALAAIQFQDPFGGVVEEVAIMRDRHHGAGVARQELLQPFNRFGVEMVGRLVEQQHVRFLQQQLAQCDAAFLAARQLADDRFPRWQAQCVGGDFQLVLERMRVATGEDCFEALLLGGELVEVGAFFGIGFVHLVQFSLRAEHFTDTDFDRLAHGLRWIQLRFLRQVADLDAGSRARLSVEVGIHAGHDPQHRRLAGTVDPEQADLGAWIERQRDVLDDLALGRHGLADAVHGVDVLHGGSAGGSGGPARAGPRECFRMSWIIAEQVVPCQLNGRKPMLRLHFASS